jgi:hypothetical protein
MRPDDITKLERLAALRDRGGLTAEEFDTQKAAVMGDRSGALTALIASGVTLLVVLLAAGGVWMSRHHAAPTGVTTSPRAKDAQLGHLATTTQAIETPIPAPSAKDAFRLVYPSAKVKVPLQGETFQVGFAPAFVVRVNSTTFALVSTGKDVVNDCHTCQGFYSVAYLGAYPGLAKEGEPFVGTGSVGGWGNPPDVAAITSLGPQPMLLVKSSSMGQGIQEEYGSILLLGDRISEVREVTEGFELSYDDSGKPGTCTITGRVTPLLYGKTFRVDYTGSWKGRSIFPVDGYGTTSEVELWKKCPDYVE